MNRKRLITGMTVILLLAVYTGMYIVLPAARQTAGKNETSESRQEENQTAQADSTKRTVVLDSGHGGFDPGKESSDGILEKHINLAIAERLKELLEKEGIRVVMTRTDDNGLYTESDSNKKIADMKKRCAIIDAAKADIVVSIHQNSYQSPEVKGAQVFYYKHSAEGKKLAQILQKSLKENLDTENKRQEKEDSTYYMLLHTGAPTVIAECGFFIQSTGSGSVKYCRIPAEGRRSTLQRNIGIFYIYRKMKKALHTAAEMEGTWKRLLHKSQKMKNRMKKYMSRHQTF